MRLCSRCEARALDDGSIALTGREELLSDEYRHRLAPYVTSIWQYLRERAQSGGTMTDMSDWLEVMKAPSAIRYALSQGIPLFWLGSANGEHMLWFADKLQLPRNIRAVAALDCAELVTHLIPAGETVAHKAFAIAKECAGNDVATPELQDCWFKLWHRVHYWDEVWIAYQRQIDAWLHIPNNPNAKPEPPAELIAELHWDKHVLRAQIPCPWLDAGNVFIEAIGAVMQGSTACIPNAIVRALKPKDTFLELKVQVTCANRIRQRIDVGMVLAACNRIGVA